MPDYLIYGANGYTGTLIAGLAAARRFGAGNPEALDAGLAGMAAVLNCAGPFSRTARPPACV